MLFFGNPAQKKILEDAGVKNAKVVIIAVHDVEYISIISHIVQNANPKAKVIAKVTDTSVFDHTVDTSNFIDIYRHTADIMATRTYAYLEEDNYSK